MKTLTGLLLGFLFATGALAGDYSYHGPRGGYRDGYRDGYKDGARSRHTRRERGSRSYSSPRRIEPAGVDLNSVYGGSRFAPMNSSRSIKSDR
ncbi:MAG TPA: hypothetical protein DEP36_02495 [Gammaproteobacteria bacterium]|nr:hypothetical protein [Gammaproteobacteria bacterium]HRF43440.1 hypothetical protein [Candidatus Competibacteraceae bacterium]